MTKISVIFALLVSILLFGGCGYKTYDLHRDVITLKDRAQVAADREDMVGYLEEMKEGLEDRGLDHGHSALIFKTPKNDLELTFQAVERIIERLHSLEGVERNSTTYQVALDDIRGIIRELHLSTDDIAYARFGWWMTLLAIGIWLLPLIVFMFVEERRYARGF